MLIEGFTKPDEVAADQTEPGDSSEDTAWGLRTYGDLVPHKFVTDAIDDYMDKASAQLKQPYPISKTSPALPRESFSGAIAPDVVSIRVMFLANEAGDALLRVALGLQIYRSRNGHYPVNLSDLVVAKILSAVPEDPFAMPGNELRYQLLPTGTYLLYSIGPDSQDDSGKGLESKNDKGKTVRTVNPHAKGDIVVGWYTY